MCFQDALSRQHQPPSSELSEARRAGPWCLLCPRLHAHPFETALGMLKHLSHAYSSCLLRRQTQQADQEREGRCICSRSGALVLLSQTQVKILKDAQRWSAMEITAGSHPQCPGVRVHACARARVCTQTQSKCNLVPHLLPWCRCESLSSPGLQSVGKDLLDCWKRLANQGWRLWISNSHSRQCRQQEEQAPEEGEDDQWITHARGRRVLHLTPGATGVFELFFIVRRCPVPCGIFGSMPGLHPNIPPWESHDNQNCPWLSPGGEITPGWEPWD